MPRFPDFVLNQAFSPDSPISDQIQIAGHATPGTVVENYVQGEDGKESVRIEATIKYTEDAHIVKGAAVSHRGLAYVIGSIHRQLSEGTLMLILNKARTV